MALVPQYAVVLALPMVIGTTSALLGNMIQNISLSCRNISTGNVFIYQVPSEILSVRLKDPDCEQRWYKGTEFLSDGTNQTRHPLVSDENLNNINLSVCIELQLNVTCGVLNQKFVYNYKVIADITPILPPSQQPSTNAHIAIPIAVSIAALVLIGLLCHRWRSGHWWGCLHGCHRRQDENGPNHIEPAAPHLNGDAQPLMDRNGSTQFAPHVNGDAVVIPMQDVTSAREEETQPASVLPNRAETVKSG